MERSRVVVGGGGLRVVGSHRAVSGVVIDECIGHEIAERD